MTRGPIPIDVEPGPPRIPAEMVRFVQRRALTMSQLTDETAHPLVLPLSVQPLDSTCQPKGEPFEALTREVSTRGLAFVHQRAVSAPYVSLALKMPSGEERKFLLQVQRCEPAGMYYDVSGRFVVDVSQPQERISPEIRVDRLAGRVDRLDEELANVKQGQEALVRIVQSLHERLRTLDVPRPENRS